MRVLVLSIGACLFLILCWGCGSSVKQKLVGTWVADGCTAEFRNDGDVLIEEDRPEVVNMRRAKYSVEASKVVIDGMGTAELLDDGSLHLAIAFQNSGGGYSVDTRIDKNLKKTGVSQ